MLVPGRHGNSIAYRYGFQGQEKDDEIKGGNGNSLNYTYRMHVPRLGRFFNVDPLSSKFPMLSPYQFASNMPIWAVDLDGLECRIYTDLSALPHSFISVIDDNGIKHVYTFGQYGQNNSEGLEGMFNQGSALVHLVGEDANDYINSEFEHYKDKISVYEISSANIDKNKIIDYYANQMKEYNVNAEKIDEHAPKYVNEENGSKAVKYKPYWLIPDGTFTENCTSVVSDGLRAGNINLSGITGFVPWVMDFELFKAATSKPNSVKDVTDMEKMDSKENWNSKEKPQIQIEPIIITD